MSGSYPPPPGPPGPLGPADQPTIPPVSAPPAGQVPTGPPPLAAPPPGGWPPAGPPPGAMPPGAPPPRKKPKWPIFVSIAAVLVLMIGISITSFLYFTGRMGIGPLSAKDKAAITAIADGVEAPGWIEATALECAAEELVADHRSKALAETGVISPSDDGWDYVGSEWRTRDARSFADHILACDEEWSDHLAAAWNLDDATCLGDVDRATVADYLAADFLVGLPDEDGNVDDGADDATTELQADGIAAFDACYVTDPDAPEVEVERAYRSVEFSVERPSGVEISVRSGSGSWQPLGGSTYTIDTDEGGERGCLEVRATTTYSWGSTAEVETESCGRAEPKRVWWEEADGCQDDSMRNCRSFLLKFEGFRNFEVVEVEYRHNDGDCRAASGACTARILIGDEGRENGTFQWSFPRDYSGRFVAIINDDERVRLPN